MPYNAEISRENPSCICFLLDQSGSMTERMAGSDRSKAEFLSDALNRTLEGLSLRCAKGEEVRDYFDIVCVGYGADIGPALGGSFEEMQLATISQVASSPTRVETRSKKVDDGAGGIIEQEVQVPVWIDPKASGRTPMCEALNMLNEILGTWTSGHGLSFPPVVIHFTDGQATDGDPTHPATQLRDLSTSDGNILLFNAHISSAGGRPVVFPVSTEGLPDEFALQLFDMSSVLPPAMAREAQSRELEVGESARGFIYNAHAGDVVSLLDIGTRPADLR